MFFGICITRAHHITSGRRELTSLFSIEGGEGGREREKKGEVRRISGPPNYFFFKRQSKGNTNRSWRLFVCFFLFKKKRWEFLF